MRILLSSYVFPPSVGGIEEVSDLLAAEFVRMGHELTVVTMTPTAEPDDRPYRVIRRPGPGSLLQCIRWCQVYLQNNVSFRLAWPLLLAPRPWVVAVAAPPFAQERQVRPWLLAKEACLRVAHVVACSAAVARGLGHSATVVPNPYRDSLFRCLAAEPRAFDLVFLGRLVSDKGANVLLDALAVLRRGGLAPRLLVIGGGPEDASLRSQCAALDLGEQVVFAGVVRGEDLVRRLNDCRIMVIPSVWEEPFGVVALEGIACGCVVIATNAGGLPEAIGPCGLTFPMGDAAALARQIADLLVDRDRIAALRRGAAAHLAGHTARAAAAGYLRVIEAAALA